ncbi:MAG: tellurite resistance protein TerC [Mycobacterium sp.]|nr:tellurite resistance protein TerC [Mycobacterium sp.]
MNSAVSPLVWGLTIAALVAIIVLDLTVIAKRQRTVTTTDAVRWVLVYVGLAAVFALGLFIFLPGSAGPEFVAGYITEYSLSVDNLFVFMIIMTRFSVPALAQDKVLYIGIVLSLVLRAVFIFAGAAAVAAASWVFYILGGFLVYTAIQLAMENSDDEPDFHENAALRFLRRILPISEDYDGGRLVTRQLGQGGRRRLLTPLVIVIAAIGIANVVFALDSIPAIFGLTNDPYIIFTANALALMGLRQLYFLIGGLLEKVIYLSKGLAIILGFIGVKLLIEALHGSRLDHVGDFHIPEIGTFTSLLFIIATLAATTAISLVKTYRDTRPQNETG